MGTIITKEAIRQNAVKAARTMCEVHNSTRYYVAYKIALRATENILKQMGIDIAKLPEF